LQNFGQKALRKAWNRIAVNIIAQKRAGVWQVARLPVLLQMGEADAYIGSFDTNLYYFNWRESTFMTISSNTFYLHSQLNKIVKIFFDLKKMPQFLHLKHCLPKRFPHLITVRKPQAQQRFFYLFP
jgi:hypothetical protein